MQKYRLYIGLGVLALLGVGVFFTFRKGNDAGETITDPWRRVDKAQTTRIVIQRPNNAPAIELQKRDNQWHMTQPATGPADSQAVSDALDALAEMHVATVVSRESASQTDLEVDPAHAIHVQLFRDGATQLDLWVGKNLDGGTAVRAPSGPTTFRVDRSIRFVLAKEPREWRDRNITHVERAHVRSVEWVNPSGTYHFDRNGDTWTGATANPAIERLDTARLNQTVTNLLELRAMDFAAPTDTTGITDASARVTIAVDNGEAVTLRVGGSKGESETFVQRQGSDVVFTMGRSHAGEIAFEVSLVQAPPPAPDGGVADAASAPVAAPAMGMPGDGGIPPEVMEQLRQQLRQRGMNMPH